MKEGTMPGDDAKRWQAYEICMQRGHSASHMTLTMNPPLSVCEFCGTYYRYEQRLIESRVPRNPADDEMGS